MVDANHEVWETRRAPAFRRLQLAKSNFALLHFFCLDILFVMSQQPRKISLSWQNGNNLNTDSFHTEYPRAGFLIWSCWKKYEQSPASVRGIKWTQMQSANSTASHKQSMHVGEPRQKIDIRVPWGHHDPKSMGRAFKDSMQLPY